MGRVGALFLQDRGRVEVGGSEEEGRGGEST